MKRHELRQVDAEVRRRLLEPSQVHTLTLVDNDGAGVRQFRAECSCGWASSWTYTNTCMGNGRRHLAAVRRSKGASW